MVMILILTLAQESSVVMTPMKVSIGYSRCDQKWFAMFHSKASTRVLVQCVQASRKCVQNRRNRSISGRLLDPKRVPTHSPRRLHAPGEQTPTRDHRYKVGTN